MILHALALCPFLPAALPARPLQGEETTPIEVSVDPRVELLSIVFRLAGNFEYDQPSSASPYAEDVERRFGPLREHAAIETARRLHETAGVSFDAVPSLALHLDEDLDLRMPLEPRPPRLDERWQPRATRAFLEELRDFAREAGYAAFLDAHADFYRAVEARLAERVLERDWVGWFDAFFGARPGARFAVHPGLLNGGANYGVGVVYGDGSELIAPVIGCDRWDDAGLPVFGEGFAQLLVHELCHSYANPFVGAHAELLEGPCTRIHRGCAPLMEAQAYANWRTLAAESLVRAVVARYLADAEGPDALRRAVDREWQRGFAWTGELQEELARFAENRERWPRFDDFAPEIVGFFEAYAPRHEEWMASAPRLVRSSPADGATDVPPGEAELVLEFDRPMAESWAVMDLTGESPDLGEVRGFADDRATLRIPMRLEPDRGYRLGLNAVGSLGFRCAESGAPLLPVTIAFRTRDG